jgi:glycosyltransferase involved in cell wall biosynthesis
MGIPVCSDFHTNFHAYTTHYNAGWLYRPIAEYLRYLHNATASTMVPTEELRDCLSHFGFERVTVVSRGVDTCLFRPSRRSDELRRQWGADADTTVVILVGRLAAEKNIDLLFRGFDALRSLRPKARLVLVGDGPERRRLEQQYPGHCFCGIRTGETLAAHYASADVFLYPSLSETFGNVTIEAMSSGLAVLAYDYGAAREHIRHDVNGLVAPFGDEASFLQQAAVLGRDPDRIERLGRAARKRAETFDWDRILDALETTLLAVASGEGVPGSTAAIDLERAP